jgi:hypothetical protein
MENSKMTILVEKFIQEHSKKIESLDIENKDIDNFIAGYNGVCPEEFKTALLVKLDFKP